MAAIGAAVGLVVGVAYAWLIITGLRTWWVAAVSTPFLTLHVTPNSLLIGWLVGVVVSWLTIRLSIRQLTRLPVGRLLAGATEASEPAGDKQVVRLAAAARSAGGVVGRAVRHRLLAAGRIAGGNLFRQRRDRARAAAGRNSLSTPRDRAE